MKIALSLVLFLSASLLLSRTPFQEGTSLVGNERVSIHTDLPYYLTGQKINLKTYLFSDNAPENTSEVVHVSLWNTDLKLLLSQRVKLTEMVGHGQIEIPSEFPSGKYLLTAHTEWMFNLPKESYGKKALYFINPNEVSSPVVEEPLTAAFFPEGGQLIADRMNKVAFRFNDKNTDFSGVVVNEAGDTINQFNTYKHGYGALNIMVKPESSYKALVQHDGNQYEFPVGDSNTDELSIKFVQTERDTLVSVLVNVGSFYSGHSVRMELKNRGNVIVAADLPVSKPFVKFLVPKLLLGEGLNHISILNDGGRIMSERFIYQKSEDLQKVEIVPENTQLEARSKVTIPVNFSNALPSGSLLKLSVSIKNTDYFPDTSIDRIDYDTDMFSEEEFGIVDVNFVRELDDLKFRNMFLIAYKPSTPQKNRNNDLFYAVEKSNRVPLSGKVTRNGKPIKQGFVYISVMGEKSQFSIARIDRTGAFGTLIYPYEGKTNVVLKLGGVDESAGDIKYELDQPLPRINPADFDVAYIPSERQLEKYLKLHADNEVIERIYYPDFSSSEEEVRELSPFFADYNLTIDYTEYIQMNSFREIQKELIENISILKKTDEIRVRKYAENRDWFLEPHEKAPLMIIDGLPIFDSKLMLDINPDIIKTIKVMNNQYFVGDIVFDGIIEIVTLNGNYFKNNNTNHATFQLNGYYTEDSRITPEKKREIVIRAEKRLPDFRHLMYWNSQLTTAADKPFNIEFYTSDDVGNFLLEINGVDQNGTSIHYEKVISIK